jgi:hypothetical protein
MAVKWIGGPGAGPRLTTRSTKPIVKGIVHRDLKAANIMLTKSGVKRLDFRLVKANNPVVAGAGLSMLRAVRRT